MKGGRPRKQINLDEIKHLRQAGLSFRAIAEEINKFLPNGKKISYVTVKRVLQKP